MKQSHIYKRLASSVPLIFAHRGYSSRAPENTLPAFRLSLDNNVEALELDVHLTKDGRLTVIHDFNTKRLCGADLDVEQSSWDTLKKLDAGSWFSQEYRGTGLCLLDEVFELCGGKVFYDIEIKAMSKFNHGLEITLDALIKKSGLEEYCIISSFNPFSIMRMKKISPKLDTAVIYADDPQVHPLLRHGEARFFTGCSIIKPQLKQVSAASCRINSRLLGLMTLPWTVNTKEDAERLSACGVCGLISDRPAEILNCQPQ